MESVANELIKNSKLAKLIKADIIKNLKLDHPMVIDIKIA